MSSLWPIQKAEFQRLSNDANLTAKVTGVYDNVPEDAVMPYVAIGEVIAVPWQTKDVKAEESTATLHCFSNYAGKKEAYEILSLMLDALNNQPLSLDDGYYIVDQQMLSMNVLVDADGTSYHGILRMKYIAKKG